MDLGEGRGLYKARQTAEGGMAVGRVFATGREQGRPLLNSQSGGKTDSHSPYHFQTRRWADPLKGQGEPGKEGGTKWEGVAAGGGLSEPA